MMLPHQKSVALLISWYLSRYPSWSLNTQSRVWSFLYFLNFSIIFLIKSVFWNTVFIVFPNRSPFRLKTKFFKCPRVHVHLLISSSPRSSYHFPSHLGALFPGGIGRRCQIPCFVWSRCWFEVRSTCWFYCSNRRLSTSRIRQLGNSKCHFYDRCWYPEVFWCSWIWSSEIYSSDNQTLHISPL